MDDPAPQPTNEIIDYVRRHLRFGWWSLLVFLTLGIVLEAMHGLKVGWYLNVGNDTRRLMWTLAHAHGVLLGLVHVAFALTVRLMPTGNGRWRKIASPCLMSASTIIPGGFFVGGITIYDGDPGLGIWLVPFGAALLFVAVFLTASTLQFSKSTQATASRTDREPRNP